MDNEKTWVQLFEDATEQSSRAMERIKAQMVDEWSQLAKLTEGDLRLREEISEVAQAVTDGLLTTDEAIARLDGFITRVAGKPPAKAGDDGRISRPSPNQEAKPL